MLYKISPKNWVGQKPTMTVKGIDNAVAFALRETELGIMDYELFDVSGSLIATFHGIDTRISRKLEEAEKSLTEANDMGRETGFKGASI